MKSVGRFACKTSDSSPSDTIIHWLKHVSFVSGSMNSNVCIFSVTQLFRTFLNKCDGSYSVNNAVNFEFGKGLVTELTPKLLKTSWNSLNVFWLTEKLSLMMPKVRPPHELT